MSNENLNNEETKENDDINNSSEDKNTTAIPTWKVVNVPNNDNETKNDETSPVEEEKTATEDIKTPVEETEEEEKPPIEETKKEEKPTQEEKPPIEETKKEEKSKSEDEKQVKDERIAKQSEELTYLTGNIIPNLKKELKELKGVKKELTDALEKSTKKYYEQLDINAILSDNLTKISAEHAVNKVRIDKLDSTIENVKKEAEDKVTFYKSKLSELDEKDVSSLKEENEKLTDDVNKKETQIEELEEKNKSLQSEVLDLRKDIIELGNYKDEVDKKTKQTVKQYEDKIKNLESELNSKQSKYDKLYNESEKTIKDLNSKIGKYKEAIEKQSSRGLLDRISNKPIDLDD